MHTFCPRKNFTPAVEMTVNRVRFFVLFVVFSFDKHQACNLDIAKKNMSTCEMIFMF